MEYKDRHGILQRSTAFAARHLMAISFVVLVLVCIIRYRLDIAPVFAADTDSYFFAWERLKLGVFDLSRTPLYPLVMGGLNDLLPYPWSLWSIQALQYVLLGVSVYCGVRIVQRLKIHPLLALGVMLLMCTMGIFTNTPRKLLSDSIGISLMMYFLYLLMRYRDTGGSPLRAFGIFVVLFMLMALRPSNAFTLVAMAILLGWWLWKRTLSRRSLLWLAAAWTLVVASVAAYGFDYHRRTGIWSVTSIGDINEIFGYQFMDLYTSLPFDLYDYPAVKDFIEELKVKSYVFVNEPERAMAIREDLQDIRRDHPGVFLRSRRDCFFINMHQPGFVAETKGWDFLVTAFAASTFICWALWRRRKHCLWSGRFWFIVLLWLLYMGNFATVVLGAPFEYGRLMAPTTFPALILWAVLIQSVLKQIQAKRAFKFHF